MLKTPLANRRAGACTMSRAPLLVVAVLVALGMSFLTTACDSDCTPGDASLCGWFCPHNCSAGAQTQTCPILMNVTGTVTVWECNIPPQYCNGAAGQNDGPLNWCGCVICQTSEQAALAQAQQILAMQSVSVDPSGPPLQCRGPIATLSTAYHTGPLFTAGECTQVTQATCTPCDDGQGGTLQSVGQYCNTGEGMAPVPGGYQCCAGLTCASTDTESGICEGTLATCPQTQPNWVGLDTGTLRNICTNNNVNGAASQSGVTLNRTCGVAFETWVLKTMGWLPRWTTPIPSPARKAKNNNGLPASVIPEQVLDQSSFMSWVKLPLSEFVEVKAVNGTLTLGTSQWQVYGLLDGVNTWPTVPAGPHAPPAVFFITTSNTAISQTPPASGGPGDHLEGRRLAADRLLRRQRRDQPPPLRRRPHEPEADVPQRLRLRVVRGVVHDLARPGADRPVDVGDGGGAGCGGGCARAGP
jgi:hypothetical protein